MKRWKKSPSLMFWLLLALLTLLPVLAYWQYRWLGEVSVAERERMQRNLKTSAAQFCQEFDQELLFAYHSLQDPLVPPLSQPRPEPFAERYRRWAAAAAHPRLIRTIYEIETAAEGQSQFKRFNPDSGQFEANHPVPELQKLQESFAKQQMAYKVLQEMLEQKVAEVGLAEPRAALVDLPGKGKVNTKTVIQVSTFNSLDARLPGLVIPLTSLPTGLLGAWSAQRYRVVLFDQEYLRQELFPALAKKHLLNLGVNDYYFAILNPDAPEATVLYQSDTELPASVLAKSDVTERFFKLPFEGRDRMMLRHFGKTEPAAMGARGQFTVGIVANEVHNEIRLGDKTEAPNLGEQLASSLRRNTEGAWQVVIKHRAGSLEAAVAKVRRRNLVISFGVLLLLGVSVGFIVMTSRRAQALAEKQIEFVAGVSHELRTPLSVICSAAENLADGVVENREQIKRYGTLIRDEGRRLTGMVEQVLEFAGAQSGKQTYELRPVVVEWVIEDALTALHLPLTESGFVVEKQLAAELPLIQADDAALSRALQNLLNNAMKYSGESLWLSLRAQVVKVVHGEELRISVTDCGLGIAPEELPHIFEPFYRGKDVTAAQIHGNGLGLSLVKHIVEAHGGRVSVESKIGQGSTFTLHLPVVREAVVMTPLIASEYEQAPSTR